MPEQLFDTDQLAADSTNVWDPPLRTARLSDDGRFRHDLTRQWGRDGRWALWVMLNPSIADADIDDQTIRQCTTFSKREGCVGLAVVNLFDFRTPYPADLKAAGYPISDECDRTIGDWASFDDTHPIICAWGAGAPADRADAVLDILHSAWAGEPLHCLGRNADGTPKHPGRLAHSTPLEVYA